MNIDANININDDEFIDALKKSGLGPDFIIKVGTRLSWADWRNYINDVNNTGQRDKIIKMVSQIMYGIC